MTPVTCLPVPAGLATVRLPVLQIEPLSGPLRSARLQHFQLELGKRFESYSPSHLVFQTPTPLKTIYDTTSLLTSITLGVAAGCVNSLWTLLDVPCCHTHRIPRRPVKASWAPSVILLFTRAVPDCLIRAQSILNPTYPWVKKKKKGQSGNASVGISDHQASGLQAKGLRGVQGPAVCACSCRHRCPLSSPRRILHDVCRCLMHAWLMQPASAGSTLQGVCVSCRPRIIGPPGS